MTTILHSANNGNTPLKQCTHPDCLQWYPATTEYFHVEKGGKNGLRSHCKECIYKKNRRNRLVHKEEYRTYGIEYRKTHKEEQSIRYQEYVRTHREERGVYNKRYTIAHKEESNARWRNRRARKKSNGGSHTAPDVQSQYKRQKGKCYYCQVKVGTNYHVDHVVPIARGGSNGPENLVIACPSCNRSKKDKLLHEWVRGGRLL